jgi:hypothetical protein
LSMLNMPFKAGNKLGKANKGSVKVSEDMFDQLKDFILSDGTAKAIGALEEIEGEDKKLYLDKYLGFLEYFKPKLARTESKVDNSGEIKIILENYGNTDSNNPV